MFLWRSLNGIEWLALRFRSGTFIFITWTQSGTSILRIQFYPKKHATFPLIVVFRSRNKEIKIKHQYIQYENDPIRISFITDNV
ncbi:MAG: hypothetical protein ACI81Y_002560 [Glaciecola sp.]|jgi:hypothetical protein